MERFLNSVQVDLQLQFGPRTPRRGLAKFAGSLLVTCSRSHSRVSTHHSGPPAACSSPSCVENELARGCLDALRAVVEAVESSAKRRAKLVGSLLVARDSRLARVRAVLTSAVVDRCSRASFLLSCSSREWL